MQNLLFKKNTHKIRNLKLNISWCKQIKEQNRFKNLIKLPFSTVKRSEQHIGLRHSKTHIMNFHSNVLYIYSCHSWERNKIYSARCFGTQHPLIYASQLCIAENVYIKGKNNTLYSEQKKIKKNPRISCPRLLYIYHSFITFQGLALRGYVPFCSCWTQLDL